LTVAPFWRSKENTPVTEPLPRKGGVIVIPNPYLWSSGPDTGGREVRISFAWNATTRALTTITVHRDAGCAYSTILVGLGVDGRPDSTERTVDLTGLEGDITVPGARVTWLAAHGLASIDDVLSLQITAS
jgi:hypothetical protein